MEIIKNDYSSVFTEALIEIISKTTGFSFEVMSEDRDCNFYEFVSMMNLNSKKGGIISLSAKESDIRTLCSFMIGVPPDKVIKDDMEDTLSEFVNMTAGNVKLRITDPDYMFAFSNPFIIRGSEMTINTKIRTNLISRELGNGEISIKLKVIF